MFKQLFFVLRPGRTVKRYFSVPVALYTVFLRPSRTVKLHVLFPRCSGQPGPSLRRSLFDPSPSKPFIYGGQKLKERLSCRGRATTTTARCADRQTDRQTRPTHTHTRIRKSTHTHTHTHTHTDPERRHCQVIAANPTLNA